MSLEAVVKLLSRRWWVPVGTRLEGTKLEPKGPRAELVSPTADQGFSSIQRRFVWLLWHLNSVWCLDSSQQSDGSQQKGAGSQLWGTWSLIRGSGSQIRGAGSEIRHDPPNLTPGLRAMCDCASASRGWIENGVCSHKNMRNYVVASQATSTNIREKHTSA